MIIYFAMIFIVFEILSMIFNQYFIDFQILGINFPFNISVIFFCIGFFILDLVTELYNKKVADKLIYGKIGCQILFVLFGLIGLNGSGLINSQLATILKTTPFMILNAVIASFIGYKITISIMQYLKIRYEGKFLMLRYLWSTLPGEIAFTLIFSALSFSQRRTPPEFFLVVVSLTVVKFFLSLIFSVIIVPITNILKFIQAKSSNQLVEFIPFI